MTRPDNTPRTPGQPPLGALLSRYLQRHTDAHADGFAADLGGEVVPYEAAPVQPIDPRLAWDETLEVVRFFRPGQETRSWQAPPQWAALVTAHEPVVAVPFCLGSYPQLMRNLQTLLHTANLEELRPGPARPAAAPAL